MRPAAHHPVMMALLLMYAYARGITSSREIERRCETDIAFCYLTGGEQPDHDTVCTFRVRHLEAFRALFVDTLRLARSSGLKKLGHLSVDGSKWRKKWGRAPAMRVSWSRWWSRRATTRGWSPRN
jgi:hypothetical protein